MKHIFKRLISTIMVFVILPFCLSFLTTVNAVDLQYGLCILEIAKNEVGYSETGTNITKYGEWYGSQIAWCGVFISWCAYQAGIPEYIIPKVAGPIGFMEFYSQRGCYYSSPSQGGTFELQIGDLYFTGSYSAPSHVGLIVNVNDSYIYTIDGNWGDKVSCRIIDKNSSEIVAFARPRYLTNHASLSFEHTIQGHWPTCSTCGLDDTTIINHTMTAYNRSPDGHWPRCRVCSYTVSDDIDNHIYGDLYESTDLHHWQVCTVCNYSKNNKTVHVFDIDVESGIKTCLVCNHEIHMSEFSEEEEYEKN